MGLNLIRGAARGAWLLWIGLLVMEGCASAPMAPPTTPPFRPREDTPIESYKFRIAVVDFSDQTGQAGDLVKTIPDILTTALFKLGRIDLYERDPLRGIPSRDAAPMVQELMEKRVIDGVLSGTVTRFSRLEKKIVIEVRLTGRNKAVMYADQHTLSFTGRREMEITRDDVILLGETLSKAVPRVPDMKIVNKNASVVTLGAGSNKGLVAGMTGYVQAILDKVNDPDTGEIPKPIPIIVGEVVIDHVNVDTAMGHIISGEEILVNDTVRFK